MRIVIAAKKVATRPREKEAVPINLRRRIKDNFGDTMCFIFDGILDAAMSKSQSTMGRRPTRASSAKIVTVKDIVRPLWFLHWR